MKELRKRAKAELRSFFPWLVAAVTVLSAHLAADALWESLAPVYYPDVHHLERTWWIVLAGHLSLFVIMVWILYRIRRSFFRPVSRHLEHKSPAAKKHLVLFLSALWPVEEFVEGVPKWLNLAFDLQPDIAEMERLKKNDRKCKWQWEMPLRAIKHHLTREGPETVTIICSRESIAQVHWFYGVCSRYAELNKTIFQLFVGDRPHVRPLSSAKLAGELGWDFESFDSLSKALAGLIKAMLKKGYEEKDIIVDFTGGNKVTSVVAAAMTFNRDIEAQYVQTDDPWKVLGYDVVHASGDTGEFGL